LASNGRTSKGRRFASSAKVGPARPTGQAKRVAGVVGRARVTAAKNRSATGGCRRSLTFELSWHQQRGALDSKRKMGRRPSA
jgi:hypothetical protein